MKTDSAPKTKFLKDYTAPPYLVGHVDMTFKLDDRKTVVVTRATYSKNPKSNEHNLILNGEGLKLHSIKKDGVRVDKTGSDVSVDNQTLTLFNPGETFILTIETEIDPANNTLLEGLYKSGDSFCTQCESEGFRRITYYQDRPDVLATFTVRLEADRDKFPILLSNGNRIDGDELPNNQHYVVFEDTTPKPCYLFALVAGDLVHLHDTFTTMSGSEVDLYIYVRPGDERQIDHAMTSLKKSMQWDEEAYGREYQYDLFNIVAVSDFNMGAMENTSLNIFNTALTLAHPDTATDMDFIRVESVIGHEYFHNWTGNRVTCRDWFQLSLKEGLTVFRDQEFSADMNSRGVQRIDDVAHLRRFQFPEDAGPLAHPIRPDNYIEIDNFYTMTVYEKGAEVIRMMHTLLGPDAYRKGTDLYFERHDGQAVTCDDFIAAMEDASGVDLTQFKLWYSQAGTPDITANGEYDVDKKTYTLRLKQHVPDTPGQANKKPMHIPVKLGLVGPDGNDILEQVLHLKSAEQSFAFEKIAKKPTPSILRGFSAPVKLSTDLSTDDLAFLMVNDNDGFNRWEAGQNLALHVLRGLITKTYNSVPDFYLNAYGTLLERAQNASEDKALMARALSIPEFQMIAQGLDIIDPDKIHNAHKGVLETLSKSFQNHLDNIVDKNETPAEFSVTPDAMGRRALKNYALKLKTHKNSKGNAALLYQAYASANNMTDRLSAFQGLISMTGTQERDRAVGDFYERYKTYPLVVDKWFSSQVIHVQDDIFGTLKKLQNHPEFNIKNPNRVRSLYAAFAMNNPAQFHDRQGRGYEFLKRAVIELNEINPMIAARLLTPVREWRRYTPDRQEMMKDVLKELKALPSLSSNVFEIVSKCLEE